MSIMRGSAFCQTDTEERRNHLLFERKAEKRSCELSDLNDILAPSYIREIQRVFTEAAVKYYSIILSIHNDVY